MPEISTILKSEESIENIISTFHIGKIFKEGVKTAIIGKPNVGKSSLLNILSGSDRAIVTEIPGTTRDLIEETVSIRGIPLILVDTAGIRQHTSDAVEKIGVERAMNAANYADLVLFVADASRPLTADDEKIAECLVSKTVILVLNKSDLPGKITDIEDLGVNAPSVKISALKNTGIEELKTAIYGVCVSEDINLGGFLLTNIRHKTLLENVLKSLSSARAAALKGMSEEFIALDLRAALDYLGKITGEVTTEDILGVIFSRFCVGK